MPRGLYVHIPFCLKKCAYCDFVSFVQGDKNAYLDALCAELNAWRGESVDSKMCIRDRIYRKSSAYIL